MMPGRKLLFLTSRFPYPITSGERLRVYQLLKELGRRFAVTLVAFDPGDAAAERALREQTGVAELRLVRQSPVERVGGALRALVQGEPLQVGYFGSRAMADLVARLAPEHDALFCHLIRRAADCLPAPKQPRVLDMCDALSENYRQTAEDGAWWSPWTWISAIEGPRTARFERRQLGEFDLVSMVNHRDAARVGIPQEKLLVLTQGVHLPAYQFVPPGARRGVGVALVGKMDFYPNRRAALWFARNVLPSLPEPAFLKLVGECPPRLKAEFEAIPRVVATGRVPSIAEACADCFAAVAPMQVATGVQTKVLEYFALGLPAVISRSVAGGLKAESEGVYLAADEPREWIDALASLRAGGDVVEARARAARAYVERHHDWKAIGGALAERVEGLLERSAEPYARAPRQVPAG